MKAAYSFITKVIRSFSFTAVLLVVVAFVVHPELSAAQDTNMPAIMSKSAYDSTLKALKQAKQTPADTAALPKSVVMQPETAVHKDSLIAVDSISDKTAQRQRKHVADSMKRRKRECFGYIAVNGGLGLPLSGYEAIGAAATGRDYSICAEFPGIASRYCWTFKFDYGENGINIPQYLHDASEYVSGAYQYSMNFPVQSNSYYTMMMGISRILPVGRLTFDIRLLFGFLMGSLPENSYNVSDSSGNSLTLTRYSSSAWALAIDFGIDVRYRINSGFSLLLNYDHLSASPYMTVVSTGFDNESFKTTAPAMSSYTQQFALNNLTIGIGYTIAGKHSK